MIDESVCMCSALMRQMYSIWSWTFFFFFNFWGGEFRPGKTSYHSNELCSRRFFSFIKKHTPHVAAATSAANYQNNIFEHFYSLSVDRKRSAWHYRSRLVAFNPGFISTIWSGPWPISCFRISNEVIIIAYVNKNSVAAIENKRAASVYSWLLKSRRYMRMDGNASSVSNFEMFFFPFFKCWKFGQKTK